MASKTAANRPNVLFITSHDLGRHLNCYGVETVNSPRLDSLAATGVRLANCFCSAPQCSPSRASMFTGRWPHSNGVMGLTHGDFGWDLHPDEEHLAGLLSRAGYHTAFAGNTHETRRPLELGFAEQLKSHGGLCAALAEAAAGWVTGQASEEHPFYLQIGFIEPHRLNPDFGHGPDISRGVTVPEYLVNELESREEFAYYQGAIRELDTAIGRILDALAETGQEENTLVLFCADHGIPFPRAKCAVYEPGLEVATILRWPGGGVAGGRVAEPRLTNLDYLPTILDLLDLPVSDRVEGRTFAPLLRGGAYTPRDVIFSEITYHDYCDPRRALRTDRWKLIANFTSSFGFMDPSQTWRRKCITKVPANPPYDYHPPVELYDLQNDPHEWENLAAKPEHAATRRDLLDRLQRQMVESKDPLLTGIPNCPLHEKALAALRGDA